MMDLTGIPAYRAVMRDLFSELNNSIEIPKLMNQTADSGALGTANHKGFYKYTPAEAKDWDKRFAKFSTDIRRLSLSFKSFNFLNFLNENICVKDANEKFIDAVKKKLNSLL